MPNYSYKCKDCDKLFIVFQNIKDKSFMKCNHIPKNNCKDNGSLSRIITGGSGIVFKGSGFYINDYSKNAKKSKTSEKKIDKKNNDKNKSS